MTAYRRWLPQVHVDFHEQGVNSPYYFAPAAEPYHKIISPWQRKCQEHIGANNARWFDARGALYFTREVFDLFYPAYGDTWPLYNGAIGMTYEQGGSSRAGRAITTALGDTLTLAYRILNHHESGMSTVEESARRHEELIGNLPSTTAKMYRTRLAITPVMCSQQARRFQNGGAAPHLGCQWHRVRHGTCGVSIQAYDYASGRTSKRTVRAGDLLIDAHQPHGGILQVLMDPDPELSDSMTYDITAWALPHAMGLQAMALKGPGAGVWTWTEAPQSQRAGATSGPMVGCCLAAEPMPFAAWPPCCAEGVTVRRADTGLHRRQGVSRGRFRDHAAQQ